MATAPRSRSGLSGVLRDWFAATGLTRTGVGVLAGAALAWVVARLQGGRTLFVLVYGVVVVVCVARFMGRARPDLEAARNELPLRLRQGQRVEVELSVRARRRVGVFLLEDTLHPHLGRSRRVPVTGLGGGTEMRHRYAVTPRLRGVYDVGPLTAVWTDPFGLTRRSTELLPATRVIVHPTTERVHDRPLTRQWEDPPTRPPESKPWPSGFEFYGMRDYVRGDDLRRVVWRAVARTGRMLIRESEQGITDRVVIAIDTDRTRHSPGDPSDTFEAAVKTAASLATRHLKNGFSVILRDNRRQLGRPGRGEVDRIPLMDELARLELGPQPLADGVESLIQAARSDAHTVIVTPHVDEPSAARLKLLVDRGTHVLLVVLTWEESDPHTLVFASSIGCQVVQLRPLSPLEAVFAREVGAGRR